VHVTADGRISHVDVVWWIKGGLISGSWSSAGAGIGVGTRVDAGVDTGVAMGVEKDALGVSVKLGMVGGVGVLLEMMLPPTGRSSTPKREGENTGLCVWFGDGEMGPRLGDTLVFK